VQWCRQGPPSAVVTNVEMHEGSVRHMDRFDIKR
jgi:hypothetical protein